MTRAQRFVQKLADGQSKRPVTRIGKVIARCSDIGTLEMYNLGVSPVIVRHEEVKPLVKFLRENFVRRDK